MENTTVDPKNKNTAAIGCSIITTDRDKNKGLENKANGPKFSVEQGEEILGIAALSSEGCTINEFGEIISPDGAKMGAKMPKTEQDRYKAYKNNMAKRREQLKQLKLEDNSLVH